jgi:hypothetical protein
MDEMAAQFDSNSQERRKKYRTRAIKSGKLIYGGFSPTVVDCAIQNLSEGGACVETKVMIEVPEIFVLRFADNTQHQVRRCWARGNLIGVEFIS